jgi:hypothetical protein
MEVSAALPPENYRGTHWIGDCVGSRAGLVAVETYFVPVAYLVVLAP